MRYLSLFSGIEAASCAWGRPGWEPSYCGEGPVILNGSGLAAHACPEIGRELRMTPATWRSVMGRGCAMGASFIEPCTLDLMQEWTCSECGDSPTR